MRRSSRVVLNLGSRKRTYSSGVRTISQKNRGTVSVRRTQVFHKHGYATFATHALRQIPTRRVAPILLGLVAGVVGSTAVLVAAEQTNWDQVRSEIKSAIKSNPQYDDGSYGPLLIRLAWHASGTYCRKTMSGGSNGGLMRFREGGYGANAGLQTARDLLEPIKKKHPEVSYSDLWTLAGCVAVEAMGGPHIPWRSGRVDHNDDTKGTPDGRLPDASKDRVHIRDVFYRMGFNDQEIVALLGAHAVGRCHTDRSGYDGPWTSSPTTFTNEFFTQLKEAKWTERNWKGPKQYEDETKSMMMLPTDLELLNDPQLKVWVDKYAADEDAFFKDFASAFSKLLELGVEYPKESLEKVQSKAEIHQKHEQYNKTHDKKETSEPPTSGWRVWFGGGKKE